MRRLFDKVFKDSSKENNQLSAKSLPSDLAYKEINFRTKRGFLAKKISNYVGLDTAHGDDLFYLSFSSTSFMDLTNENDPLIFLQLSEKMLLWGVKNQDIVQQIKNTDISDEIQNAMLKAFEIVKSDLFSNPSIAVEQQEFTLSNKQHDDEKWLVYRDVILAATQGKFLLITEKEVNRYMEGIVFCEGTINDRSDIPLCRNRAKESLESKFISKTTIMSWLLVLSEAITNTIKHAEGGKMTLIEDVENNEVRFVIEDRGPGFSLKELPNATLLAGYSTKKSMGQGFTLMMKMAKQVSLFTSPNGSILILNFDSSKG